ncbi:TonB-dependent receptor [Massilibacteroides sp.]|uniref:TonB-dependent receptor n=1 Tax=Massilibacteroides sp. TaxID=2034766 RepID=UPI00263260D1|nr:TonB-dependent receptor [Massilibacteroides sp.]MDD4514204.1 TonB-dependent receptor [Massilibacteroides sp.]
MKIKPSLTNFRLSLNRKLIMVCFLFLSTILNIKGFPIFAENNNSQNVKISLNKENTKLENILNDIETQTDFLFVYHNDVNLDKKVSIRAKNKTIFEILDQLFDESIKYSIENSYVILSTNTDIKNRDILSTTKSQEKKVTGIILDSYNEPIIGANVVEKGTTNGTISDINGIFNLILQTNNPTLVISYIGFKTQEVRIGNEENLTIKLTEDTETLEEVVVVGYGVQKRASVTGSVASLQSKDIATVKTPNVTNTLAGKLPGLRAVQRSGAPGDDAASIDIRGFGNALVIVDGVERDFTLIDANDIESISVLKDASASVYGFKGANGVILVTTKKGEIGKPKINYSGYYGLQSITRYPELLNGYEYAMLYNEAQQNVGVAAPYSNEQLEQYKQGIGTTDWYDEVIRGTIPQMYHNLNVSGGSEKVKYYFSLGYTDQEGMYKSKDYTYSKYNVRSNISAEIVKGFTVDLQLGGWFDSRNKPYEAEPLTRSIQMAKPVFSIYANDNENYWSNPGDKGNPVHLSDIDNVGYDRRDRREFNGSIALNWQIPWVEGLSAKALFAYDYNNNYVKKWYKEYYEYVYNESTEEYKTQASHTISELTTEFKNYFKPNVQTSVNYARTFNGKHNINALALFESYNDRTDNAMAYRQFAIGAIDQIDAGDKLNMNNGGTAKVSAHAGLVGRLNYAYDNRYMAEVSFRYDGSYKFSPDKRWGFFPALSLGWRASEEQFFKDALPMVENFKLRGSIGKIGDEGDFDAYQYLTGYTYPNNSYVLGSSGLTNGAADRGMPNTNLTWYKSTTYNVGFETSVLQGKFNAEFDYFVRKRDGLLATRILTLPTTFGQALPQENLNSDRTKGFEIVIGHRNKINDFTYEIKANFSSTRQYNDYIERAESSNMYDNWKNNSNDRYKDIKWGKKYIGQFQSFDEILNAPVQDGNGNKSLLPGDLQFEDVNNDGIIDDKDNLPIGYSSSPRMYYGINLYGAYKGFDLTIFFQGAAGHSVFMGGDLMDPFIQQGLGNGLAMWLDRWHREDPTDMNSKWIPGYMPALRPTGYQNNTQNSTWTLQKADYLRLKTLEIGYTLPKSVLSKLSIEALRVYVNSFNPLTFTNRTGIMKYMDPENDNSSLRYYPQMKSFNFGVSLTF